MAVCATVDVRFSAAVVRGSVIAANGLVIVAMIGEACCATGLTADAMVDAGEVKRLEDAVLALVTSGVRPVASGVASTLGGGCATELDVGTPIADETTLGFVVVGVEAAKRAVFAGSCFVSGRGV